MPVASSRATALPWYCYALVLGAALSQAAVRRERRRAIGRALARGGWLTIGLVLLVGLGLGLAWPWLFTTFHQVFFPGGNWQFPEDSGLIRLFPEQFWYDTALVLAGLAALEGLLAVGLGRALGRDTAAPTLADDQGNPEPA